MVETNTITLAVVSTKLDAICETINELKNSIDGAEKKRDGQFKDIDNKLDELFQWKAKMMGGLYIIYFLLGIFGSSIIYILIKIIGG